MNLRAVFFDMGGTIESYRFDMSLRLKNTCLIRECLESGGIHLDVTDEALANTVTAGTRAYHHWNLVSQVELPAAQIWKQFVFKDYPVSEQALEPIAEKLAFIYETQFYDRQMRPEMPAVLARIKELGLKIGCISNVQSRGQVPFNLRRYGIIDYFDPIVLSSEYGRRKPDPTIFYHAARLANVPTGACIYVGDKISRDIVGGHRAGFRLAIQIHFDSCDEEKDEGAVPDVIIEDMRELLPIIEHELEVDRQAASISTRGGIKALFFDAGDILYFRPNRGENLRRFLSENAHQKVAEFDGKREVLKRQAYQGEIDQAQYYTRMIELYGIQGVETVAKGAAALDLDDRTVEIMPGVPETLLALKKRGLILGIITDTALPLYIKLDWFEKAGFGGVWDCITSSREIGVCKPALAVYAQALQNANVQSSEAAFVGHMASELEGARQAGMRTIAFNYEKEAKADFYVDHFTDLLGVPIINLNGTGKTH
jgi:putative hydrolase of the HAD superfamily